MTMIVLSSIFYSVVAAWPVWTGGMTAELPHSTTGPVSTGAKILDRIRYNTDLVRPAERLVRSRPPHFPPRR